MSDCERCWDTPCTCGWGYRDWSDERAADIIAAVVKMRTRVDAARILDRAVKLALPGATDEDAG